VIEWDAPTLMTGLLDYWITCFRLPPYNRRLNVFLPNTDSEWGRLLLPACFTVVLGETAHHPPSGSGSAFGWSPGPRFPGGLFAGSQRRAVVCPVRGSGVLSPVPLIQPSRNVVRFPTRESIPGVLYGMSFGMKPESGPDGVWMPRILFRGLVQAARPADRTVQRRRRRGSPRETVWLVLLKVDVRSL
jgi:hypothetical protein